jgi:hypothetical protein
LTEKKKGTEKKKEKKKGTRTLSVGVDLGVIFSAAF